MKCPRHGLELKKASIGGRFYACEKGEVWRRHDEGETLEFMFIIKGLHARP